MVNEMKKREYDHGPTLKDKLVEIKEKHGIHAVAEALMSPLGRIAQEFSSGTRLGLGFGSFSPFTKMDSKTIGFMGVEYLTDHMNKFDWPLAPEIGFRGLKQAKMGDDNSVKEAMAIFGIKSLSLSGINIEFEVPLAVRNGGFLEPSVMMVNGTPRIMCQAEIDSLMDRCTFNEPMDIRGGMFTPPLEQETRESLLVLREEIGDMPHVNRGMFYIAKQAQGEPVYEPAPAERDLTTRTPQQLGEDVKYLANTKSLPELRRMQDLVRAQQSIAYEARDDLAVGNLQVFEQVLTHAVMRREFPEDFTANKKAQTGNLYQKGLDILSEEMTIDWEGILQNVSGKIESATTFEELQKIDFDYTTQRSHVPLEMQIKIGEWLDEKSKELFGKSWREESHERFYASRKAQAVSEIEVDKIINLRQQGMDLNMIAQEMDIDFATVQQIWEQYQEEMIRAMRQVSQGRR